MPLCRSHTIYMRGRFYSPAWHVFLNSDQGADPNQLNQYAYCGGSPMMRTDPSGLDQICLNDDGSFVDGGDGDSGGEGGNTGGSAPSPAPPSSTGMPVSGAPGTTTGADGTTTSVTQVAPGSAVPSQIVITGSLPNDPSTTLAQTGQTWVDPALLQPNPMIATAKNLVRDVAGLNPYVGAINTANSLRTDRSPMNVATSVYSSLPISGQAINAINIAVDVGTLVGQFFTQYVLTPMVTNDNRGPQPFNANGQYNPTLDEGAPF